ncbi:MAG: hypothetical protein P8M72_06735 [Gammaproteobacteria bacterium]|nr:hypothetical protein [Gammaproteobacteria bacterium]
MSDYSLPEEKSKTLDSVMENLNRQISPVPGFKPPTVEKEALYCPLPESCTQEDKNEFRSAAVFLASLASEVKAWRSQLPENYQPAVMAILQGGVQVHVMKLAQVSFDGIRIEGLLQDNPVTVFAHQSTVQMMCYAMEIKEEKERNPIGFIWPDRNEEV